MSDKNLANEVKRLSATITAVERQRNEALTARAHADATVSLLQDSLRESQASLNSANAEIARLMARLAELDAKPEDAKTPKKKAA